MNFMFSWQEQYLTRSLRSLVRYTSCHSDIKFISSRHHVVSSILYNSDLLGCLCWSNTIWSRFTTTVPWSSSSSESESKSAKEGLSSLMVDALDSNTSPATGLSSIFPSGKTLPKKSLSRLVFHVNNQTTQAWSRSQNNELQHWLWQWLHFLYV